jgi:hypothetical protein
MLRNIEIMDEYSMKISEMRALLDQLEKVQEHKQNLELSMTNNRNIHVQDPNAMFSPPTHSTPQVLSQPQANTGGAVSYQKLQSIPLPEFSGDALYWHSFADRFQALVDRDSRLSQVAKLDYLKGCLKGEAARLVTHIPSTNENYKIAWKLLERRFGDEWPTLVRHLETMFNFKPLTSKNSKDLRRLHETFSLATQGLHNIGKPFEGYVLSFLIVSKLDPDSREFYENKVMEESGDEGRKIPAPLEVLDFIERRARTLEHTSSIKLGVQAPVHKAKGAAAYVRSDPPKHNGKPPLQNSQKTQVKTIPPKSQVTEQEKCCCCQGSHKIWTCGKFLAAPVKERIDVVTKNKLCRVCLGQGHFAAKCQSRWSCKTCNRRHSTYLHWEQGK